MVLLKRKPVILTPLPSLSTILQPVAPPPPPLDQPEPNKKTKKVDTAPPPLETEEIPLPDGKDDEEQLERLLSLFQGDYSMGPGVGKGKGRGGVNKVLGTVTSLDLDKLGKASLSNGTNGDHKESEVGENGEVEGSGASGSTWRIWDRECFYIPETGEVFTDYEWVWLLGSEDLG